jgi:hypothetical protein
MAQMITHKKFTEDENLKISCLNIEILGAVYVPEELRRVTSKNRTDLAWAHGGVNLPIISYQRTKL